MIATLLLLLAFATVCVGVRKELFREGRKLDRFDIALVTIALLTFVAGLAAQISDQIEQRRINDAWGRRQVMLDATGAAINFRDNDPLLKKAAMIQARAAGSRLDQLAKGSCGVGAFCQPSEEDRESIKLAKEILAEFPQNDNK